MNILHVNTSDRGGAGNASVRLHLGLLEQSIDSHLLVRSDSKGVPNCSVFTPKPPVKQVPSWSERVKNKLHRLAVELRLSDPRPPVDPDELAERQRRRAFLSSRPKGLSWFSYPDTDIDIMESEAYQQADIIHLHWVADFLDWELFFSKNTKPVVWTLHDQNAFLGGQHVNERFLGIDDLGRPIPRRMSLDEEREESHILQMKRQALLNARNIHIVSPSTWMKREAEESDLLGRFVHYHIPNHFPSSIFRPLDQRACRDVLGLPKDLKIVLFVADSMDVSLKGFNFLLKAFHELSESNGSDILLCSVGKWSESMADGGLKTINLGHIQDERLMAIAYSAADVFVIPSLEDNLPNTMIESILCGTPVIGFPTGGIVDAIGEQYGNGYICEEISVESLKKTILKFLKENDAFDRKSIAANAAKKYTGTAITSQYLKLYQQITMKR